MNEWFTIWEHHNPPANLTVLPIIQCSATTVDFLPDMIRIWGLVLLWCFREHTGQRETGFPTC